MFHHILVPLDGSRRAESALSVAANIARSIGASLLLLHVIPQSMDIPVYPLKPRHLLEEDGASDAYKALLAYMTRIQCSKELQGLHVDTSIATGLVSQRILLCIETQAIDLVVMCSRGATGLKRWTMGSVAQRIVRHSPVPVLVLQEAAGTLCNQHPAGPRPVRVLVALDGSPQAETVLKPAAALSRALSAPEPGALHLVCVIPSPSSTETGSPHLDISEARLYLQMTTQAAREELCRAGGDLLIHTSTVEANNLAEALVRVAEGLTDVDACDTIAIASHGQTGLARRLIGSIAEHLLEKTRLPLLVVHVPQFADRKGKPGESTPVRESKSKAVSDIRHP
jgi:nucleotide-binding universal stress UspA family protein